jgi:hypothetical protein
MESTGIGKLFSAACEASGDTEETRWSENLRNTDGDFIMHLMQ